jgi:hypothetical protein
VLLSTQNFLYITKITIQVFTRRDRGKFKNRSQLESELNASHDKKHKAAGPKVCGFKPGRGQLIFKGDKNP